MSEISIMGEPSPREISIELSGMRAPIEIKDRYPGELSDIYAANGLVMSGSAELLEGAEIGRALAMTPGFFMPEKGDYLGPVVSEEGLVIKGLAVWRAKPKNVAK